MLLTFNDPLIKYQHETFEAYCKIEFLFFILHKKWNKDTFLKVVYEASLFAVYYVWFNINQRFLMCIMGMRTTLAAV